MAEQRDGTSRELRRLAIAFATAVVVVVGVQIRDSGNHPQAASPPADPDPAPSVPTTPLDSSLTIAVSGEILPHPSIVDHAARFGDVSGVDYDFGAVFADLEPAVAAADLAICHLEVPVAPPGTELSGYPAFGIPAEIGVGIGATGWDRCSTASNHSNDRGTRGIVATLDALDAAGVEQSGMARTLEEATTAPITEVGGHHVAHLSYTWGFNGTPPAEPWMANVTDPDRIRADAHLATVMGADLVVVSLHWGVEYDGSGSAAQRSLADELLASPYIDLLVGHGPHVLQPIEQFHGKYALLSVGNTVANQGSERPRTYDGVVASVRFSAGADGSLVADELVAEPTWYDRTAGRVRLVDAALAAGDLASIHGELEASRNRSAEVMAPYVATR